MKLAILGSTNGTDMQSIIEAISKGKLLAKIEIVLSDRAHASILDRARKHGITARYIDPSGKTRADYDAEILRMLSVYKPDIILLIGYMRILSQAFVRAYKDRIINVHPSLLPAFAGGMDLNVHTSVIDAGVPETGCTIHLVDEGIDTGKILLQKKCAVLQDDTPESLKKKVQRLEGQALVHVLQSWDTLQS